ncbi:MAG: hypothetical protein H0X64_03605 [Gemmatimonadaceae bacterium]|nr:hypothetical protein [Gemmatimonadaceae bacterium]
MAALVAVLLWVWRPLMLGDGAIVAGDLFVPLRREALIATFATFWNPMLEFPNVETIDRAAFVLPSLLLGDPVTVQRAWLLVSIFGAALAMYVATRWLGAGPTSALLLAIAYGANPWLAIRVQHVFLLQAYAALPLVIASWWRPASPWRTVGLVALLSLGSTTPHGAVALWALSVAAIAARPSWSALQSGLAVATWYFAVNVYWIGPVAVFMSGYDLVPSRVTWEMLETFSRSADFAAVARLEGYWWPLGFLPDPGRAGWAGIALALAALLAWVRPRPEVLVLTLLASVFLLMAVGTNVPWWIGAFTIEGPFADRFGWLFRDPNKAVGALAAMMLLLVALVPSGRRGERMGLARLLAGSLVVTYLLVAVPRTEAYVASAYRAHSMPASLDGTFDWLADRGERTIWLPGYFGSLTFWNGDQLVPEVLSLSSPVPVLSPYAYDVRATTAFQAFDSGALIGDTLGDPRGLAQRWHLRWLAHHRDVMPIRLQPPGAFDTRVVARSIALLRLDLPVAHTDDPFTIYDLGPLPKSVTTVERAALTHRPIAAAVVASAGFGPEELALVDADHASLAEVIALPGDDVRLLFGADILSFDLAAAAPHTAPGERWSRFDETATAWWPQLAQRHGPAPRGVGGVVSTSRAGALLTASRYVPLGEYRLLLRGYEGPDAGVVDVTVGPGDVEVRRIDLSQPTAAMAWHDLGVVTIDEARDVAIELRNRDGSNVVAHVVLIGTDELERARERLAGLDVTWLWPVPEACRTRAFSTDHDLRSDFATLPSPLPTDVALSSGLTWHQVAFIELRIDGVAGDDDMLELWTVADGVWVLLGRVMPWWRGERVVRIAVRASSFAAAPAGAAVPATLLRLLPAADSGQTAAAASVKEVRIVGVPDCDVRVRIDAPGTLSLVGDGGFDASVRINDGPAVDLGSGGAVTVETGDDVRFEFEDGVPVETLFLRIRREAAARTKPVAESESSGRERERILDSSCPDSWRLVRSGTRYVDGMRGTVGKAAVDIVVVDGLMAGAWLPPALCGPLEIHNPWIRLGSSTLLLSALSALVLIAIGVVRTVGEIKR